MKKVGILMGSDSDLPVVQKGTAILKELEVPFEVHVYSAHRTPEQARKFCSEARENGFGVLICAAGMAAHLAGAAAAVSTLPVIGIPCKGPVLDGMDALLSTVQMPSGVPVATVGIGNGGAGCPSAGKARQGCRKSPGKRRRHRCETVSIKKYNIRSMYHGKETRLHRKDQECLRTR